MPLVASHKDLVVWQKSVSLAKSIYGLSSSFPPFERYGLAQYMRRAAISVASNIAEGSARQYRAEFVQFLHIARGSLAEVETQAFIAVGLGYIGQDTTLAKDTAEVGRLLTALIRSLRKSS